MTAPVGTDRTPLDDLKYALSSGGLGEAAQAAGEKLLGRLTSPVKVVILGFPQTGKSTIFNMLAGQVVLPEGMTFPTTQLVWGEVDRTVYTLRDASQKVFDRVELGAAAHMKPALIRLEMPIEQLKKISLLEVVASSDETDQQRAMRWASKRADIALWCSAGFSNKEEELWRMMPDALLGHSFLVLNKADLLDATGDIDDRMNAVKDVASHYFHSIIPLAGRQALASMQGDGEDSETLFRSSGGQELISAILRDVRAGRRADMDNIEVFLHRYGLTRVEPDEDLEPVEQGPVSSEPAESAYEAPPEPVESAPEISPEPVSMLQPAATPEPPSMIRPDGSNVSVFAAALERVKSGLEEKAADQDAFEPDGEITEMPDFEALEEYKSKPAVLPAAGERNTRQEALKYLADQASELAKLVKDNPEQSGAAVIERCVQAADHLGDLVLNDDGADPELAGYEQRCQEASELLVLMQLEAGEAKPQDAVAVLFQLRREIEERSPV